MFDEVAHPLTFRNFQLLLQILQLPGKNLGGLLRLRDNSVSAYERGVQLPEHLGGIVPHTAEIGFQKLIQLVHTDVMAGAAL
ncbi:hypothetical protein SDC9_92779 [bioreactor metagenome]|uniref:Uncharacterized protein n=1 Tax=bioreactor metagenome TaxID=1076179 RepID=A0A645A5H1_9ZZZZ